MSVNSLNDFIEILNKNNELHTINVRVNPDLEICEITDRVSKHGGKALLFKNNGTEFPVLLNMFGSEKRMLLALGLDSYFDFQERIHKIFALTNEKLKIQHLPQMLKMLSELNKTRPIYLKRKGTCQQVIHSKPDIGILPVLKCWTYDGGKFITLPMVHTMSPVSGDYNIGMYRMQIFDSETTGMHWHRHKGGASHFEEYKKLKKMMPVVVTLGGSPVYTYCATAPLPEKINEYAFAGYLTKKRIKMVKALTCEFFIPEDVDFVIEGYIDPNEDLRTEGPFGDHTGFYSLPGKYPIFHVTCLTHRKNAVYPATVVGIPPMEDAYLGKATERLFLPLLQKVLIPELCSLYLPVEGGFHNLVIASIKKSYPGQAVKVMNALWGAGQMMFSRNIIIVDEEIDITDYTELLRNCMSHIEIPWSFHFMSGPLDVLDHANNTATFGKKLGIDATQKFPEEKQNLSETTVTLEISELLRKNPEIIGVNTMLIEKGIGMLFIFIDKERAGDIRNKHKEYIEKFGVKCPYIVFVDYRADHFNFSELLWLILSNTDPEVDMFFHYADKNYFAGIDATIKRSGLDNISISRPNVITMDDVTIETINSKWNEMGFKEFLPSPSLRYKKITLNKEGYLYDK